MIPCHIPKMQYHQRKKIRFFPKNGLTIFPTNGMISTETDTELGKGVAREYVKQEQVTWENGGSRCYAN